MSDLVEEYKSRLRRAMGKLGELEAALEAERGARSAPIAILAAGCRFPPAIRGTQALFDQLAAGLDAVVPAPPRARLPASAEADPALRGAGWGAYLDDVERFDADFFGLSPREATVLDPQQRLLLEVTWEALERAGQVVSRLAGARVGVFVGLTTNDYLERCLASERHRQEFHSVTGNGHCFAAGRLSYTFGFQGPSVTVDTACSSSLVALHLACQSLRDGESSLAIAGGVQVIASSVGSVLLARSQALSPDGRCKTFDAGADGFVRGEGCGVVVLKRLGDALRDGDPIAAVVRGSAVNQDGRSTGLTAPSALAQEELLRAALARAGLAPDDVDYIETHGTGTSLGDPIEFEALRAVYGQPRPDGRPLLLGAVKSNLGHLEAAAGMAGLLKLVACLERQAVPANLHFQALNPRMSLEGTPFAIATETNPWPAGPRSRRGGVSSFGLSGTNAHVLVEEAPPENRPEETADEAARPAAEPGASLLVLSARSEPAVRGLAGAWADVLDRPGPPLAELTAAAALRRDHHPHRLAVVGRAPGEIAEVLRAVAAGQETRLAVRGQAELGGAPRIVFVLPGQGSQWAGMGRELLAEEPVFRAAIERCDAVIRAETGWSLTEALIAPEATSRLARTEVAQPALVAIEIALTELLASWGVVPDAVIGHSVAEIAAAHVAGALELEDALRLACLRGRILERATGGGRMASVTVDPARAASFVNGRADRLAVAAVNDPGAVVLSGDAEALDEVLAAMKREGIGSQRLPVEYAFHSPLVADLAAELGRALGPAAGRPTRIPLYSTLLGARTDGPALGRDYWVRNAAEPVSFAAAVASAIADGHRLFVEVGPHPSLSLHIERCLAAAGATGRAVTTLRRRKEERRAMLTALGSLYAAGCDVDFERLFAAPRPAHPARPGDDRRDPPARDVRLASHASRRALAALPTYPWQRERHWVDDAPAAASPSAPDQAVAALLADPLRLGEELARSAGLGADAGRIAAVLLEELRRRLVPERAAATDDGHHVVRWQRAPAAPPRSGGHWAILPDRGGAGEALAAALAAGGAEASVLPDLAGIDVAAWLAACVEGCGPLDGVVEMRGLDAAPSAAGALEAATGALSLVQAVLALPGGPPRLWIVTRGAAGGDEIGAPTSPAQASLHGLARVIAVENPELRGGVIDLPDRDEDADHDDNGAALAATLLAGGGEPMVALRGGDRWVPRLERATLAAASALPGLRADASYLVTGGSEGVERVLAGWLLERGAGEVWVLAPRSDQGAADPAEPLDPRIRWANASPGDDGALGAVLDAIAGGDRPLRGVLHAAGRRDDGVLRRQTGERFARVFAVRLASAWELDRRTRELPEPLDWFVIFSSVSGLRGAVGQGAWAAASTALDALAARRRADGLAALCIRWAEPARASDPAAAPIGPAQGLAWIERLLAAGAGESAILAGDERSGSGPRGDAGSPDADLADAVRAAPAASRRALVRDAVQGEVERVLGFPPSRRAPLRDGFFELGMDSLLAVELKNRLQRRIGQPLSATAVFDHPNVEALADHLEELLRGPAIAAPARAPSPPARAEPTALAAHVAELSDAELSALVDGELASLLSSLPSP